MKWDNIHMKNKKTSTNSLDLTDIRNRISGENKSPLDLTDIRNRISGEGLNLEENKNDWLYNVYNICNTSIRFLYIHGSWSTTLDKWYGYGYCCKEYI